MPKPNQNRMFVQVVGVKGRSPGGDAPTTEQGQGVSTNPKEGTKFRKQLLRGV